MDKDEINSMLLEELLGISNKRLKYIFEGKNLDEESSTDEDQPVDVISLDDISDDDFVIISDEEGQINKSEKRKKIKEELKEKSRKVKKEKLDKIDANNKNKVKSKNKNVSAEKEPVGEENLMSVLELLELQARARAIRSQLELENRKKKEHKDISEPAQNIEDEDDDEIIIEVPKEEEIVIPSSDSENEKNDDYSSQSNSKHNVQELDNRPREIENTEELLVESASSEPKNLKDVIDINAGKDDSQEEIMAVSSESNIPSDNTKLIKDGEDMPTSSNGDTQVPESEETKQCEKTSKIKCECYKDDDDVSNTDVVSSINNDDDSQSNDETTKNESKEKKLRHLKNKLESYKKEMAVHQNIKILEDIVVKEKADQNNQVLEENDDLVINVDQDDLDCIICD
ncbi:rRNA methyltransferase 2, mitochondrial isoform X2 [Sitophilus oryzae]|nr:rRNA methyltransferase 2, mitochondrial isoform X2 [Sitophilus oryzae]